MHTAHRIDGLTLEEYVIPNLDFWNASGADATAITAASLRSHPGLTCGTSLGFGTTLTLDGGHAHGDGGPSLSGLSPRNHTAVLHGACEEVSAALD
jgi:hypothetical protein